MSGGLLEVLYSDNVVKYNIEIPKIPGLRGKNIGYDGYHYYEISGEKKVINLLDSSDEVSREMAWEILEKKKIKDPYDREDIDFQGLELFAKIIHDSSKEKKARNK